MIWGGGPGGKFENEFFLEEALLNFFFLEKELRIFFFSISSGPAQIVNGRPLRMQEDPANQNFRYCMFMWAIPFFYPFLKGAEWKIKKKCRGGLRKNVKCVGMSQGRNKNGGCLEKFPFCPTLRIKNGIALTHYLWHFPNHCNILFKYVHFFITHGYVLLNSMLILQGV